MGPLEQGLDRGTATPIWYNGNRMALVALPTERVLRLGIVVYAVNGGDVRTEMSLPIPWADVSAIVEHLRKLVDRWRPRRVGDPLLMRDGRVGTIREIDANGRMLVHVPGVLSAREEAGAQARDDERERDEGDGSDRDG